MDSMPGFLQKYFSRNNLIVLYPEQFGEEVPLTTFVDPLSTEMNTAPSALWMRIKDWYRSVVALKRRFSRGKKRINRIDL